MAAKVRCIVSMSLSLDVPFPTLGHREYHHMLRQLEVLKDGAAKDSSSSKLLVLLLPCQCVGGPKKASCGLESGHRLNI